MMSLTSVTSFLLPAVLATREEGRDLHCADQLRKVSAGLHAYAEVHGALPAGWTVEPTRISAYGWASAILPYLDEASLHSRIEFDRRIAEASYEAQTTTPDAYLCPSDYGGRSFPLFAELGAPGENAQKSTKMLAILPRANYVGVFGVIEPDEVPGNSGHGVFIEGRGIRYDEITRGLSQVALLGERTTRKLPSTWLGFVIAGEDAEGRVVGSATFGPNRVDTDECEFDSRHFAHVNFAFVDGHVSRVQDDIDQRVYQQFARRQE